LVRDLTEKKLRAAMAKATEAMRAAAEIDNFLEAEEKTVPKVAVKPR
jgi:hypothetical protein